MKLRRLETKEEAEKKRKRNTLIASIIMIGILVLSTAGYFSLSGNEEKKSNEAIQNIGNYWIANYSGQQLRFTNSPDSVKNVSVGFISNINSYYGKIVYISSDNELANYEIGANIGKYAARVQLACYGQCEKNLPEKNCTDSLIVFNQSGQNKVYQEENCVFIDGDMRAVDAFLYRIFGLI
jgi:hypothetical protein